MSEIDSTAHSTFYFTAQTGFTAAHRYHRPEWSDEKNKEVFGPCNNPDGHGHDYILSVEIRLTSELSEDRVILEKVLTDFQRQMDHRHLNFYVAEFRDGQTVPTTENLALYCEREIRKLAPKLQFTRLKLQERPDLWVELSF